MDLRHSTETGLVVRWLLARQGDIRCLDRLLVTGFRDNGFLLQFEQTADPWARVKLVGEKIHDLLLAFAKLTP